MRDMNDNWRAKASMWCVGARRIPHASKNTNVAIELYHSNLKSILNILQVNVLSEDAWIGSSIITWRMWLHIIVVTRMFCHHTRINNPYINILICMDEDVAYVGSVNNKPKVWTTHSHDSKWAQCDYPIIQHGITCKNTMKILHMATLVDLTIPFS